MEFSLVGETSLMVTLLIIHTKRKGGRRDVCSIFWWKIQKTKKECKMIFIITIIPKLLWGLAASLQIYNNCISTSYFTNIYILVK